VNLVDKAILVTGGTGSLGSRFVRRVVPLARKVIVVSRDEHQQVLMRRELYPIFGEKVQFALGDVRDRNRMYRLFKGVQIVIHMAAQKHVHWSEENPFEAVQTNIIGSQNVIDAAIDYGVEHVIAVSSDKAVNPINLYGATKLAADRLFIASNNSHTKFTVVRFGNFLGSRGSVIKRFESLVSKDGSKTVFPITSPEMTRFFISLDDAVDFILKVLEISQGGEIFIPKMESWRIVDLALAICPDAELKVIGVRKGEKLYEDLVSEHEALCTFEAEDYFMTVPDEQGPDNGLVRVPPGFKYTSKSVTCTDLGEIKKKINNC